jgi:hypothetical protein
MMGLSSSSLTGAPAVAVHDQRDVLGYARGEHASVKASFVEPPWGWNQEAKCCRPAPSSPGCRITDLLPAIRQGIQPVAGEPHRDGVLR